MSQQLLSSFCLRNVARFGSNWHLRSPPKGAKPDLAGVGLRTSQGCIIAAPRKKQAMEMTEYGKHGKP